MIAFPKRRARRESTRLFLVRAAETDFGRKGRLQGNVDLPLTAEGRGEVLRQVEQLRPLVGGGATVYCGSDLAARETAILLSPLCSGRLRVLPQLAGVSFGLWEGQLAVDVENRHSRMYEQWLRNACCITPPGGEEMDRAAKRASSAVRLIRKKHRKGSVIVVASDCLRGLIWCALHDQPAENVFQICRGLSPVEVADYQGLS
jgi:broad specificity phosphatase PhoE